MDWQRIRHDCRFTRCGNVEYLIVPRPKVGENVHTGRRWVYYLYELLSRPYPAGSGWATVGYHDSARNAMRAAAG